MLIQIEIPDAVIAGILCTGFEQGIGYWASETDLIKAGRKPKVAHGFGDYIDRFLTSGVLGITEHETGKQHAICREDIRKGLDVMREKYPLHFALIVEIGDTVDWVTADVLIQCAIFGEAKYG